MKRTSKTKPDEQAQLEAARIIAKDPLRYPGVLQQWAQLVIDKYSAPEPEWQDDGKVPW